MQPSVVPPKRAGTFPKKFEIPESEGVLDLWSAWFPCSRGLPAGPCSDYSTFVRDMRDDRIDSVSGEDPEATREDRSTWENSTYPKDLQSDEDWEAFFGRVRQGLKALLRMSFGYSTGGTAISDLVQEVNLRAYQRSSQLEDSVSLEAVVRNVARDISAERHRKNRTRKREHRRESVNQVATAAAQNFGPAEFTEAAEFTQCVSEAVHQLPPPLRDIVVLELEGLGRAEGPYTQTEMGELIGLSRQRVSERLTRAHQELARLLGGEA